MADIPKGLGSFKDLIKRFTDAKGLWNLWRSVHQEAFDFANPDRENFRFRSPGQRKNRHIFDSTATIGLSQFASNLESSLIPPWADWMQFVAGSETPKDLENQANELLEDATDIFFDHLNHSNFSTEMEPTFKDLGIGTGAIMIQENPISAETAFKFTNIPLSEFYPERTAGGPIQNSWRKQKVPIPVILQTWPGADIPPQLQKKINNGDSSDVEILTANLFNPDDKKHWMLVIYQPEKAVLFSQSFDTKRVIASRWSVSPGETFGRGPIILCLPDIRTVNKVKQFILENAAIQMSGVYTGVSDGVFNPHTVRIAPGSIIPVSSNNTANPSLTALPRSGDIGLGGLVLDDLQNNIKKCLMVEPLGDISDPVRSATENVIREREALRMQGASIGRQMSELIAPIVEAAVDILRERGQMPDIRIDGQDVSMKMQSPLAKAQDLDDFQSSQVWWQTVGTLPEAVVAGSVRIEQLPEFWAEKLGVPASLVRSEQEREAIAAAAVEAAPQVIEGGQL